MTEKEFFSLQRGTVISGRFNPQKYYVIDCEDVFGSGYIDKEYPVYGATELNGFSQIRISKSDAQFWNIEGKIK